MSLDITIKQVHTVLCPHCGQPVKTEVVDEVPGGGRDWYPFLESIGYYVPYVPYEKRTPENDWYGKDMTIATEQALALVEYIKKHPFIYGAEAKNLVAMALLDGDAIVINADW